MSKMCLGSYISIYVKNEFLVLTRSAQMAASLRLTSQAAQQPSRPPTHQDTALVLMIAYK